MTFVRSPWSPRCFFVLWRMCLCYLASRWCYLNWQNFPPPRVVSVQSYWFWDAGVDFEDLGLFLEYLKANIGWRGPYYCRPFWICCWLWESSAWSSKNSSSSNRVHIFLWIPFLFWAVVFFNSVNGKQIQVQERKLFPIVGAVAEVSFIVSAEIHSLCWCFLYSTTSSHVVRKD